MDHTLVGSNLRHALSGIEQHQGFTQAASLLTPRGEARLRGEAHVTLSAYVEADRNRKSGAAKAKKEIRRSDPTTELFELLAEIRQEYAAAAHPRLGISLHALKLLHVDSLLAGVHGKLAPRYHVGHTQLGVFEIAYDDSNHLRVTPYGQRILRGEAHVTLSAYVEPTPLTASMASRSAGMRTAISISVASLKTM